MPIRELPARTVLREAASAYTMTAPDRFEEGERELAARCPEVGSLGEAERARVREALARASADGANFAFVDHACASLALAGNARAVRWVLETVPAAPSPRALSYGRDLA
jgi:hypothetical protein